MFEQIGGIVAVPTHVFKVVVGEGAAEELKGIVFVAENRNWANGWRFADGIVSIDWLEQRAGLSFMPELDPSDEATLGDSGAIWVEPATLAPVALHRSETAVGVHLAIGSSFGAVLGALVLQQL